MAGTQPTSISQNIFCYARLPKGHDETADGEQQKMGSEEKKAKIKSGEQQP
jgi:hypothetical protein